MAMFHRGPALATFVVFLTTGQSWCNTAESGSGDAQRSSSAPQSAHQSYSEPASRADTTERLRQQSPLVIPVPAPLAPTKVSAAAQRDLMNRSARAAWTYVTREVTSAGFVGATRNYQFLTVWDMASTLAAAYSARELGFIKPAQYKAFVGRTLTSMEKLQLYNNTAFNRMYSSATGAMVDNKAEVSTVGGGYSSLDHGRLLVWLRIIGNTDPEFAKRAQAIVARLDMSRIVKDGYMQGEEITKAGEHRAYQEGRVGYEQYAAEGFALWNAKVDSAVDFATNAKTVVVNGITIVTDSRGGDVMTSEPFVMMGLELGWKNAIWKNLGLAVLALQEARFRQTGIVTMVSEDAIPVPPAYFYYYLLYHEGKPFVVSTVGGTVSDSFPRWVSAKAAFGYHALTPGDYTWRALQTVKFGGAADGWTAGVFEGTKNSTKTYNLNTAAIVMESAAYMKRGCAFIRPSCR